MKQVVQNYKNGKVKLLTVPVPRCAANRLLVRNTQSLVSLGTERSIIRLGEKSLLGKARARPDLVKRAIEKARTEGLRKTWQEAAGRLDTPTPLGYSAAGVVLETGVSVKGFSAGDRVAIIGQGIASHAEYLHVPMNMACRIPDNVSDEAAAFGMLGTIALHGIRKSNCDFGSTVVVIGGGLLGLLSLLILKAYGCHVVLIDLLPAKVALAKKLGADFATTKTDELTDYLNASTQRFGADVCLITAATQSPEPVNNAVQWCRRGGKIVVVGTGDIHPDRNLLWEKECELVVSRAGGDGALLDNDVDLPIDLARWTPQRNLTEFLRLLSCGAIDVSMLITHRFPIADAEKVYEDISAGRLSDGIGVLFDYPNPSAIEHTVRLPGFQQQHESAIGVSVIGGGVFAKSLLLPTLQKIKNVNLQTLVTASGASGEHSGKRFGFQFASTDHNAAFANAETKAVVAAAPHHLHAELVLTALRQQKALYIEKPLCVNLEELDALNKAFAAVEAAPILQVGHNRRYSPHTQKIKSWLANRVQPLVMHYRINAGFVPAAHWVHSDAEGRSRIVGELSHFIDFMQCVTEEVPQRIFAERIAGDEGAALSNDNIVVTIKFNRGSIANLTYTASGSRSISREVVEIFCEGKSICLDDFRSSVCYSPQGKQKFRTRSQALGYQESLSHFIDCVSNVSTPTVSVETMLLTMQTVFAIESALALGESVCIS